MEKIPASCKGVKCMIAGCTNLASHKVGEENVFDRNTQSEEHSAFDMRHNLTTYLCDGHFYHLMRRDTKYGLEDNRNF